MTRSYDGSGNQSLHGSLRAKWFFTGVVACRRCHGSNRLDPLTWHWPLTDCRPLAELWVTDNRTRVTKHAVIRTVAVSATYSPWACSRMPVLLPHSAGTGPMSRCSLQGYRHVRRFGHSLRVISRWLSIVDAGARKVRPPSFGAFVVPRGLWWRSTHPRDNQLPN